MPAIIMALRIARGEAKEPGAMPCIGLIDLDALLEALQPLDIGWNVETGQGRNDRRLQAAV